MHTSAPELLTALRLAYAMNPKTATHHVTRRGPRVIAFPKAYVEAMAPKHVIEDLWRTGIVHRTFPSLTYATSQGPRYAFYRDRFLSGEAVNGPSEPEVNHADALLDAVRKLVETGGFLDGVHFTRKGDVCLTRDRLLSLSGTIRIERALAELKARDALKVTKSGYTYITSIGGRSASVYAFRAEALSPA